MSILATVTAKNMANLVSSLSFVVNISHTIVLTDNNDSLLCHKIVWYSYVKASKYPEY